MRPPAERNFRPCLGTEEEGWVVVDAEAGYVVARRPGWAPSPLGDRWDVVDGAVWVPGAVRALLPFCELRRYSVFSIEPQTSASMQTRANRPKIGKS